MSLRHAAPAGAYALVPCWHSKEAFLNDYLPAAIAARGEVLAAHGVRPETFLAWAAREAEEADPRGRRIVVSRAVVARDLDLSDRHVKRCRAAARALGLYVDVVVGRHMGREERLVEHANQSRRRCLANESALSVPAWLAQLVEPRTPRRRPQKRRTSRTAARTGLAAARAAARQAWEATAAPEAATAAQPATDPAEGSADAHQSNVPPSTEWTKSTPNLAKSVSSGARSARRPAPPAEKHAANGTQAADSAADRAAEGHAPLAGVPEERHEEGGYRLAQRLHARLSWLRAVPVWRTARLLQRFAAAGWTADHVIEALERLHRDRSWKTPTAAHVRNGWALLAWYLREVDAHRDHPRRQTWERRDAALAAQAERAGLTLDQLRERLAEVAGDRPRTGSTRETGWVTPGHRETTIAGLRAQLAAQRDTGGQTGDQASSREPGGRRLARVGD